MAIPKMDPTFYKMAFDEARSRGPIDESSFYQNYLMQRGQTMDAFTNMIGTAVEASSKLFTELQESHEDFKEFLKDPDAGVDQRKAAEDFLKTKRTERRKAKGREAKNAIDMEISSYLRDMQKEAPAYRSWEANIEAGNFDETLTSDGAMAFQKNIMDSYSGKQTDDSFSYTNVDGKALYNFKYTDPNTGEVEEFKDYTMREVRDLFKTKNSTSIMDIEKVAQDVEKNSFKKQFAEWTPQEVENTIEDYRRSIDRVFKQQDGFSTVINTKINGKESFVEALSNPNSEVSQYLFTELYKLKPSLDTSGKDSKPDGIISEADFGSPAAYAEMVDSLTKQKKLGKVNKNFNKPLARELYARYLTTQTGESSFNKGRKEAGHDIKETSKLSAAERLLYAKQAASKAENEKSIKQLRNGDKLVKLGLNTTAVKMGDNYVILGRTEAGKSPQVNLEKETHELLTPNDIIQYLGGKVEKTITEDSSIIPDDPRQEQIKLIMDSNPNLTREQAEKLYKYQQDLNTK